VHSILRLVDLDAGSITIDGVDLSAVPPELVRTKLVAVPQDAYTLDGTVRRNVDPTGSASDEDVLGVLDRVRLRAKVEARGGLDAAVSSGGGDNHFSQGEVQLLVFARAMLRKSKVLIVDEFTSR
jgi:ATP-binding cassette, subfamily C (CFTR/MRP), member 1